MRRGTVSYQSAKSLKVIVVKAGVARVGLHHICDENQVSQDSIEPRACSVLDDNENSHHASHQEFVFLQLGSAGLPFYQLEKMSEQILCKWLNVCAGNIALPASSVKNSTRSTAMAA